MIGNDIISALFMERHDQSRSERHAQKILTTDELSQWMNWPNRKRATWVYWAAKEAVYKIYIKNGGRRLFCPKSFNLQLADYPDTDVISMLCREGQKEVINITIKLNPQWIHAMAYTEGQNESELTYIIQPIISSSTAMQSALTRKLLVDNLAVKTNKPVALCTGTNGVPSIKGWDITMSHCQTFGAVAFIQQ